MNMSIEEMRAIHYKSALGAVRDVLEAKNNHNLAKIYAAVTFCDVVLGMSDQEVEREINAVEL